MSKLPENDWLTGGIYDSEHKQYMLLAWLQKVKREFDAAKLYPALADLIDEHRRLNGLQQDKHALGKLFKGELSRIDLQSMKLVYDRLSNHPDLDAYLNELIAFAIPKIDKAINEGKDLYDLVEEHLEFDPIGLLPLYKDEGYLFVYNEPQHEVLAYRYQRSPITFGEERFQQLGLELVERRRKSIAETFSHIKLSLVNRFRELPNPATYLIRSSLSFPLNETLLPIAKRRLLRELAA